MNELILRVCVLIVARTLAKNLIFEPLLTQYSEHNASKIELNQEIRENLRGYEWSDPRLLGEVGDLADHQN